MPNARRVAVADSEWRDEVIEQLGALRDELSDGRHDTPSAIVVLYDEPKSVNIHVGGQCIDDMVQVLEALDVTGYDRILDRRRTGQAS